MKLFIRNMACDCCKVLVKDELEKLGIKTSQIELGEVEVDVKENIPDKKQQQFNNAIKKAGLEVIESREGILLEKIKRVMHEYVYNSKEKKLVNFSTYLSGQLHYDYAYLSTFFSELQASTIEKYLISIKIDRVKELIVLRELTLTEIADKLHYSSLGHLSNQFKKVTGLSPTHFKKLKEKRLTFSKS